MPEDNKVKRKRPNLIDLAAEIWAAKKIKEDSREKEKEGDEESKEKKEGN